MKDIEIGKTLKLKSGSPIMTIVAMARENENRVCCRRFNNNGDYASEWFHIDSLTDAGRR